MPIEVDFQPVGRHVLVEPGTTILEAAQKAGVGLSAVCGGGGNCGTCIVRLSDAAPVGPVNLLERSELSEGDLVAGLRLACQVELLGDTRVDIPPESLTAIQRTQVEGEERPVEVSPPVLAYDLAIPPATQTDLRADWERLSDTLVSIGAERPLHRPLGVLEQLPRLMRDHDWKLRVGVRGNTVVSLAAPSSPFLGLAVDIGTTKVAGYLVDLVSGDTLAMRGVMNPQIAYGEDVMARVAYTLDREDGSRILQRSIVDTVNELARDLCAQDSSLELNPSHIVEAVVVGNTAMHHLFLGLPVRQLGLAPYVAAVSAPLDIRASDAGLALAPGATLHLLPNIAGFVGADHVAMLLATDAYLPGLSGHTRRSTETTPAFNTIGDKAARVVVRLDIGTNTEITLAAGDRLVACSTASGPAFEGAHIRDGMRAAEGAIERVRVSNGKLEYQTIGEGPAVGICGSGILDIIAQLKLAGVLNQRGAMDREHVLVRQGNGSPEVLLVPATATRHGRDIVINRKDVSEIQLSKGAMRAGIEILLQQLGLFANDIDDFIIAGAFGTYIDVSSAITIGMFPSIPLDRFRQVGNAAGIGAKLALLSTDKRNQAAALATRVEYLELTNYPGFTNEFAKAMSL